VKKGTESVIRKEENFEVIRYNYYFESKEEMERFKLKKDEKLIMCSFYTEYINYPCMTQVEVIRAIKSKHIYNSESYQAFIKNLQLVQKNFNYSNEWYNYWIDYINKKPYQEAKYLIELLNDFSISGMESNW